MKRGQRHTHRVRYEWDDGTKGSRSFGNAVDAETFAEQQRARTGPIGDGTCTAIVEPIERRP